MKRTSTPSTAAIFSTFSTPDRDSSCTTTSRFLFALASYCSPGATLGKAWAVYKGP